MATNALVTPEQYLATHFDREPEYVRGEIVERSLPTSLHSEAQQRLQVLLDRVGCCYPNLRMRLAEDLYRIPDIAVYEERVAEQVPDHPPLLIVEISSPDDKLHELFEKFEDYRTWGVKNIWLVEPELKKLYVYTQGLTEVARFELADLTITPADLFA